MGQEFSVQVKNASDFDIAEIIIDGTREHVGTSSLISKGLSVKLRPESKRGNGKVRIYRGSKIIRECSFPYQMQMASFKQQWEITNEGLTQKGGFFSDPAYSWSFVDESKLINDYLCTSKPYPK